MSADRDHIEGRPSPPTVRALSPPPVTAQRASGTRQPAGRSWCSAATMAGCRVRPFPPTVCKSSPPPLMGRRASAMRPPARRSSRYAAHEKWVRSASFSPQRCAHRHRLGVGNFPQDAGARGRARKRGHSVATANRPLVGVPPPMVPGLRLYWCLHPEAWRLGRRGQAGCTSCLADTGS
jgi:hypothetical protein